MQRHLAIYNIARIIFEVAVEERGDPSQLIDYITGKTSALNTWSNAELADQLEYLTGDENVQVVGGTTPNPDRPIELQLSRHEAILLSSLLLARSEPLATSLEKAVYPDSEAGQFAKYCDHRYLTELREMSDRITERIRELDVAKKQQYVEDDLTDPET